jgi:hypothetical protein
MTARRCSNRRGHTKEGRSFIKILDTIMALLAWIVFALVLWAIMPLLLKLVALSNGINHLFGP